MSTPAPPPIPSTAPIIVFISNVHKNEDDYGIQTVESFVKVFFPAIGILDKAHRQLQTQNPTKSIVFKKSHVKDYKSVAESIIFSIGAEGSKQIAAAQPISLNSSAQSLDSEPEHTFYPLITTVSKLTDKIVDEIPSVEAVMRIYLTTSKNVDETERRILLSDPATKIETYYLIAAQPSNADIVDFIIEQNKPSSSLLDSLSESHF